MRSGSLPKNKLKPLSFAEALMGPTYTPEEKKARGRVEARKRRNKKEHEEGKDEKKNEASDIRQSFRNMGRELVSLISTILWESGKEDVEAPARADGTVLRVLPLAQNMSKVFDRCETKAVRTELVEGSGRADGFAMARKGILDCYPVRMWCHMSHHKKPFQAQLGVMAFRILEARE